MHSSNSSSCNPFPENEFTSKSEQDPNFFFFGFPDSPHMHLDCLHFLDSHLYLNTPPGYSTAADHMPAVVGNPNNPAAVTKKDRHSKINTARGPRDRRIRMSLDIARKFFDLQDLLGYDKASRTVDWLLRSSSSAIRALGVSESCTSEDCGEAVSFSAAARGTKSRRGKRGKRGGVQKRATVARESRRKARERARERTSQKRRLMRESGSGSGGVVRMYEYDAADQVQVQVVEDLSSDEARISGATTHLLCPSNCFHFQDTTHSAFFHQDEQIEEFEFNGKPWEAYNSFNMCG